MTWLAVVKMGGNGRRGFEYSYWIAFSLLFMMSCLKACNSSIKAVAVEVHGCTERERKALLEFEAGVDDHGGMLSSWGNTTTGGEDDDCCHWRGVECDSHTGHVITLHLSHQNLGGKIDATSLAELQHLKHLNLSWNFFEGSIPAELGNLSNLQSLDLSWNELRCERLDWLSGLPLLTRLDLSGVNLSASVHWPEAINRLPDSLTELYLAATGLPRISLSHINSSTTSSLEVLDLSWNAFTSSIYPWLFSFQMNSTRLVHLRLSHNNLNGSIQDAFGSLTNSLAYLDLSWNQLEGEIPKSLGDLCNLQRLYVSYNKLNGLLEKDFLACSNQTLELLDLSKNQFRGTPFPHLNGFSRLKELYLGFNQLNGTFPQSIIAQLPLLEVLSLSSNSLRGIVSATPLFGLSKLRHLDLSFNSLLTFNISLDQLPQFQAHSIWLTSCKLGPRFPNWLQNQKRLVVLDISASGISDALPNWLLNLSSNLEWLNISNNHILGSLTDIQSAPTFGLDTSSNCLEGSIPPSLFEAQWLDLSKNMFSGSISLSCQITNQSTYQGLSHLDLSNNQLLGKLPKCWGQWKDLIVLNLANNNFSGKIKHSVGLLRNLQALHLRNNSFIGAVPSSLNNCRDLSLIDLGENKLSGRLPTWIGGSLSDLSVLNLRSNRFNGNIPSSICRLEFIQMLDLSSNNLSGTIPKCLNNFTAMAHNGSSSVIAYFDPVSYGQTTYIDYTMVQWKGKEVKYKETLGLVMSIDFSNNKLTGEIPAQVTDLVELVALNLSRNHLSGPIPSTIGQLKSLDFLDLSHNWLNGGIPSSLVEIDRLSVLDLSNNKLAGKIPSSTQLQSFNASTYEENSGLCGPPLPKMCTEDEDKPKEEIPFIGMHGSKEDVWFYGNIVLGFIIGFWGVCGSLLLNRSWRMAYFQFLIKMKDRFYVATTIHVINKLARTFQS